MQGRIDLQTTTSALDTSAVKTEVSSRSPSTTWTLGKEELIVRPLAVSRTSALTWYSGCDLARAYRAWPPR